MERDLDFMLSDSIRRGDPLAFELLFKKYYAPLCMFATKYTHDTDAAREVVQNLFVHLWEHRADMRIDRSVKAYLTTAVRRNCIRYVQQQRPNLPIDVLPENDQLADELHDSLELDELYRQLLAAIDQLPEQCQKIFRLSRFDELKYAEIAERLHISVKTVEAQMGKALKLLRRKFEEHLLVLWVLQW